MVDEDALPGKIRDNSAEVSLRGFNSIPISMAAFRDALPTRFPPMSRALKGPPGVQR